ncbi:DNA polymerase III subunit delta' [Kordiimonas aquimaris]|uniref:DNA polymerase III subunit delta' n=1 Tax=Kordiimonas aquimaris TaxID=707591 RepID=UPI0021CE2648|nr:DNA polymerase III subunit delta' [Kordiimonas aquimaris]
MDKEALHDHPRFTQALIGHEVAERQFLEAVNGERIHHGWLISGPKGIGKASLAWRIAKFLLVNNPGKEDAGLFGEALPAEPFHSLSTDNENDAVARVEAGGHGGLFLVERSENEKTGKMRNDIVIDDVRGLIKFFSQTAAEGGWRVAIVDAADELNVNAANALLKILEEPPEKAILLLVAHSPGKLLPTIKSRCRSLALKPLQNDSLSAVLAMRYPDMDIAEMNAISMMAEGAPGRAVELVSQGGSGLYRELAALLAPLPRLDMVNVHAFAAKLGAIKADAEYRLFVQMLTGWLQRLIRQYVTGQAADDIMPGESEQITRISALARVDQWLDLWEKVGHLTARADAVNLDRKQVIISIFASLKATTQA